MRVRLTPSVCLSAANLRRFSSADSATGGTDFKRPSKREVLFLHHRNLIKTFDLPPRREKTAKELPLRGRGACRPLCGRQASETPKVWHGAAVTEGVQKKRRQRREPLSAKAPSQREYFCIRSAVAPIMPPSPREVSAQSADGRSYSSMMLLPVISFGTGSPM